MYKTPSSLSSRTVHNFASLLEPGWTHNHDLSALPVDFAFFNMLVFDVVEYTPHQQLHQNQRKTMQLFVFETVVACDIAIRSRKKNDAEDPLAHRVASRGSDEIPLSVAVKLATSCRISFPAVWMVKKSCFTPSQE